MPGHDMIIDWPRERDCLGHLRPQPGHPEAGDVGGVREILYYRARQVGSDLDPQAWHAVGY